MAAKDYTLGVSELTGTLFITKVSKRDKNLMTDDRRVVEKQEIIPVILQWTDAQLEKNQDTLTITAGGKPVAEIKLLTRKSEIPNPKSEI